MLDEKRIRQMTKLAFFEKKEEKNALRIGRYFRSDYIGKELLKNFFLASIGYILVLAVAVLYHIEWLVDEIDTIDLQFAAAGPEPPAHGTSLCGHLLPPPHGCRYPSGGDHGRSGAGGPQRQGPVCGPVQLQRRDAGEGHGHSE